MSTASNGLRINPMDKPVRPAEFLFLGDSLTFGINGPWDETFAGIFENRSGKPIINAGVPSSPPTPYLYQYQKASAAGALRMPHTVIVGIDISDVQGEAAIWKDGKRHPRQASEADAAHRWTSEQTSSLRKFLASNLLATRTNYRFLRYRLSFFLAAA